MRTIVFITVISGALAWAQAQPAAKGQAGEPRIGYAAQSQSETEMVGCVSGSSEHLMLGHGQLVYRLQGNTTGLKSAVGKMVKVSGHIAAEKTKGASAPAFQVTKAQVVQAWCGAAGSGSPVAIGGKTGNEGHSQAVTTTDSAGQVTPGAETQAGKVQAPGENSGLGGKSQGAKPTAAEGAPPNFEQAAQNPAAAEQIAASAERAEINNSQHQLGVNAQPNYRQNAKQESQQANQAAGTGYAQNRDNQKGTELPGASQQISGSKKEQEKRSEKAAEAQKPRPVLVGCLTSTGKDSHEFYLKEQKSGTQYRLDGLREQMKDHVNHLVEVVGKPGDDSPKSVAGAKEPVFEVTGVQDLKPTCGANH
ncbi:MAG: hypothetical protein ACR2IF_16595 [Terriglobales bacterium]